jgi:bilirubin oxidase
VLVNSIHEDHDMMAAFNVSVLADFGYPETTKFIDPMEERWRSKPQDVSKSSEAYIKQQLLPSFSGLDAYDDVEGVGKALDDYYKGSRISSGTVAPAAATGTGVAAAAATTTSATTTSAPAVAVQNTFATVTTKPGSSSKTTSSAKATTTTKKNSGKSRARAVRMKLT